MEAMRWLTSNGPAVEGVEAIRERLQAMMDDAIAALDGTHFDLAEPVRRVEAMIAPPGSAAAPYYTGPRRTSPGPGRTWLPTLGRTRFPLWDLVSIWYHEGVPGHHLQLAQWAYVSGQLSTYQTSLGSVGANVEGWALYAERLMDELGYFTDPGERLGFLDAQQLRAVRVVIDIGMHLGLPIPDDAEGALADHRASPGRRSSRGRSWARTPAPTSPSSTASWSATWASPGRRSATSWGSGRGWTAGRRRSEPGAPPSTSRRGTWPRCHRARWVSTTSRRSSRGSRRGAREREHGDGGAPGHAQDRPGRAEPGPGPREREGHEPQVARARDRRRCPGSAVRAARRGQQRQDDERDGQQGALDGVVVDAHRDVADDLAGVPPVARYIRSAWSHGTTPSAATTSSGADGDRGPRRSRSRSGTRSDRQ